MVRALAALTLITAALSCSRVPVFEDYQTQSPVPQANSFYQHLSIADLFWSASLVIDGRYAYDGPAGSVAEVARVHAFDRARNEAHCRSDVSLRMIAASLSLRDGSILAAVNGFCDSHAHLSITDRRQILFAAGDHLVAVGADGQPRSVPRPCLSLRCQLDDDRSRGVTTAAQRRLLNEFRRTNSWFLDVYLYALRTHRVTTFPTKICAEPSFACASADVYRQLLKLKYQV